MSRMKPLYILLIVGVVGWLLVQTFQPRLLDPAAVSRPVEARGDLASDEKNTIEIFRKSAQKKKKKGRLI